MRLIDADALVENIKSEIDKANKVPLDDDRKYFYCAGMRNVIRLVKPMPTIDTVKHGRWILDENEKIPLYQIKTCSLCGCRVNGTQFNFCPHCGAKMLGMEE